MDGLAAPGHLHHDAIDAGLREQLAPDAFEQRDIPRVRMARLESLQSIGRLLQARQRKDPRGPRCIKDDRAPIRRAR